MYNLLIVPTFASDLAATAREEARSVIARAAATLPGVRSALVQPTLPGVYNGGDLICRFAFTDRATCEAALAGAAWAPAGALLADRATVSGCERVGYDGGLSGGASPGAGLYRVALFCANVRPDAERLAAFTADTVAMPGHVRTIRRWQLSPTHHAAGTRPWTHVWEQEYPDRAGLEGAYMLHPVHWAHVERWFDPEYPEWLVDTVLVHTFCDFDQPVIVG
jgi:Stress responsive A/B Barrel Domain